MNQQRIEKAAHQRHNNIWMHEQIVTLPLTSLTVHLRSLRVLCKDDGEPITRQGAWSRVRYAAGRANVPTGVHILRHSFCSHLAMRGAAGKAIQELAGHQELGTTQRYMHLSPEARESAIKLLEGFEPR
jgi:site-specific recombinase XerD